MEKSAIILVGGSSRRFGRDKGLLKLANKSLVLHIVDNISNLVDEILVVVSSESQEKTYKLLEPMVKVVIDRYDTRSPLVGALTGFECTRGEYSLLLPCDTPFVSSQIASFLLELCVNREAVIPRWPNGYMEPLQAVYCTRSAMAAANEALQNSKVSMDSMIVRLEDVSYVSTSVLKRMDPKLMTFFNINTPEDLRTARNMLPRIRATSF